MHRARISARRLLQGIGLAALAAVAGCEEKEPTGQIVATVNGKEISVHQLSAELSDLPLPDSLDRKQLRATLLEGVIDRELEVQIAREKGLDKTPEFLVLMKRNEENLMASMLGHQFAQAVAPPTENEVKGYMQEHPLQFAQRQRIFMDELIFQGPKDRRKLAVLADVHTLDEADRVLRSMGIMAVRAEGSLDTGMTEPEVAAEIDKAPPGEPILLPFEDRLVIGVVTRREPIVSKPESATLAAARAVREQSLLRESNAQITAARSTATIEYSPGFEPARKGAALR